MLTTLSLVLALPAAPPAPALPPPVEVYMAGDVDERNVTYRCFRIPTLLTLPSGTLLAFAEGRVDGCRPDARANRPIVVRASKDEGQTWGQIRVAGPPLGNAGTNYPGAFIRDGSTVVLRYALTNGSVFSTESDDEGWTWSAPVEASQPAGQKCGSAWPKAFGNDEVVIPCGSAGSARSSDGGRTCTPAPRAPCRALLSQCKDAKAT